MHNYKIHIFNKILGTRSLSKLSEDAGLSKGNLSRIARGQSASIETIRKLAAYSAEPIEAERLISLFGFTSKRQVNDEEWEEASTKIQKILFERKLGYSGLADILGVTPSNVEFLFSGRFNPDEEEVRCIADALGTSYEFLVGKTSSRHVSHACSVQRSIRILGTIRAGLPLTHEQNFDGDYVLSEEISADFALNVIGDSMSWAGISEGDIALLKYGVPPNNGDIVAAGRQDGDWEATLKFFISNAGKPILRAANPEYADITLDDTWSIVGVLTHVIKRAPSIVQYQELVSLKEDHDTGWNAVIETATEYGLDAESVKGFISGLHMMISAARK